MYRSLVRMLEALTFARPVARSRVASCRIVTSSDSDLLSRQPHAYRPARPDGPWFEAKQHHLLARIHDNPTKHKRAVESLVVPSHRSGAVPVIGHVAIERLMVNESAKTRIAG